MPQHTTINQQIKRYKALERACLLKNTELTTIQAEKVTIFSTTIPDGNVSKHARLFGIGRSLAIKHVADYRKLIKKGVQK